MIDQNGVDRRRLLFDNLLPALSIAYTIIIYSMIYSFHTKQGNKITKMKRIANYERIWENAKKIIKEKVQ